MRFIRFLALSCAVAVALPAAAGETIHFVANDGLRQAREALLAGKPADAARRAEAVLRAAKRDSVGAPPRALLYQAHSLLCVCYRLEEDWPNAETQCDKAVALGSKNWRAYVNRAALALDRGAFAAAARDLARATELGPADDPAIRANQELLRRAIAQ